jgi:hypothetical protein
MPHMVSVRRAILALLLVLGLAAGAVHAPAVAIPAPEEPAFSYDCHGPVPAASETAPSSGSRLPPCCPEGCDGACLAPATTTGLVAPVYPARWDRVTHARGAQHLLLSETPEGFEDPPRFRV